jgi:hypothetical protein
MVELISVGIACISLLGVIFLYFKIQKDLEELAENLARELGEQLYDMLKGLKNIPKEYYTDMGARGGATKQIKALDTRIAEDILGAQDPLIQAGLDMFPRVKEYIDENPHLLPQLIPRLKALSEVPGFQLGDLFKPDTSRRDRRHPFDREE